MSTNVVPVNRVGRRGPDGFQRVDRWAAGVRYGVPEWCRTRPHRGDCAASQVNVGVSKVCAIFEAIGRMGLAGGVPREW